ncbi:MAG: universal stress protein, partial [Bacteroidota bacterium]
MIGTSYKRWMVGMDFSKMDQLLTWWVDYFSQAIKPDVIYFVHVEKYFDNPYYIPKELSAKLEVEDETQRSVIENLVSNHLTNKGVEVRIEVIEGKPFDTLLRWVELKKIDFFIAGRKDEMDGRGIFPHKLSRKLPCPVLFIPEIQQKTIEKILVPIDFS